MFAGLGEIWRVASRFILTPVTIRQVGLDGYGTWTLLFSLCAYGSMFNASFGFAYSKYTAEYEHKEDFEGLSYIIGSGIALVGGLSLIFSAVLWLVHVPLLSYLNVPDAAMSDASIALALVILCLFLRMSFGCTFDVLSGLQRADLNYKLNLLGSALEFAVTLPLLLAGKGLVGLAIGYATGQVLTTVLAWWLCRRECPRLPLSPFRVSREGLRLVTLLGGKFQALSFMNIAFDQGIKLLLSRLLGLTSVGVYELAYKLIGLGTTISNSLLGPLMPAFAHLHAGEGAERARSLFISSSKAVALTTAISLGFVALFADQLVLAWTGLLVPEAAWTLRMLAPTKFLVMLTGVPTASLRGKGSVVLEMWFGIVGIVCLVASIYPLYQWAGYRGVIYARVVEDLGGAGWFLWAYFRSERLPIIGYARDVFGRVTLAVGLAMIGVSAMRYLLPWTITWDLPPRWEAAVSAIAWGGVFFLLTLAASWFVVLTRQESASLVSLGRRKLGFARASGDS